MGDEEGSQFSQYGIGRALSPVVVEAMTLLWNTRLDEAERLLLSSPGHAGDVWSQMMYCECVLWRSMFSDAGYEENMRLVAAAEKLATEVYDRLSPGVVSGIRSWWNRSSNAAAPAAPEMPAWVRLRMLFEAELVLAEVAGMYAAIHLKQESYLKGGYQGRRAWKWYETASAHLQELYAMRPAMRDVLRPLQGNLLFGVGMYHFMVSLVPPALQFLVSAVGFEGDRRKGMQEMQFALDSGGTRAAHANLFLIVITWFFFDDKARSHALMQSMRGRFPTAGFLEAIMGFLVRYEDDNARGAEYFRAAREHAAQIPQFQLQCVYEIANCDFFANRWHEAAVGFHQYLTQATSRNFKAFGAWKLGFCYWMSEEGDRVAALYRQVDQWVRPMFPFDKFAQRKAAEFLAAGRFDAFEEKAYAAYFLCDAGEHARAQPLIDQAAAILVDADGKESAFRGTMERGDMLALVDHVRARILCAESGDGVAQGVVLHERVISRDSTIVRENWLVVMSMVMLAELTLRNGSPEDTLRAVKRIKSYKRAYDFDKGVFILCVQFTEVAKARIAAASSRGNSSTSVPTS
jgi:hypothetical protein